MFCVCIYIDGVGRRTLVLCVCIDIDEVGRRT